MKNKTAGYVVELAYNDFSSALQRNAMLQEFLGPEYRLFKVAEEAVAIFDALSSWFIWYSFITGDRNLMYDETHSGIKPIPECVSYLNS